MRVVLHLIFRFIFIFPLVLLLLTGCADNSSQEKKAIAKVKAPYAANAIILEITAVPQLNIWYDMPNSCTVLVIQSVSQPAMKKILNNPAQVKSLFNGAGAGDEILQVDRYTVMPGQRNKLHIDRVENSRVVAMVAGYFPFPGRKHMAMFTVPVELSRHGWINPQWQANLVSFQASIVLGSSALLKTEMVNPPENSENIYMENDIPNEKELEGK